MQWQLPLAAFPSVAESNVSSSSETSQGGGTQGTSGKRGAGGVFQLLRVNAKSSRYTMDILAGMKCVSVSRLLDSL